MSLPPYCFSLIRLYNQLSCPVARIFYAPDTLQHLQPVAGIVRQLARIEFEVLCRKLPLSSSDEIHENKHVKEHIAKKQGLSMHTQLSVQVTGTTEEKRRME